MLEPDYESSKDLSIRLSNSRGWVQQYVSRIIIMVKEKEAEQEKYFDLERAYDTRTREWSEIQQEYILLLNEVLPLRKQLLLANQLAKEVIAEKEKDETLIESYNQVIKQLTAKLDEFQTIDHAKFEIANKQVEADKKQKKNLRRDLADRNAKIDELKTNLNNKSSLHKEFCKKIYLFLQDDMECKEGNNMRPEFKEIYNDALHYLHIEYENHNQVKSEITQGIFKEGPLKKFRYWLGNNSFSCDINAISTIKRQELNSIDIEGELLENYMLSSSEIDNILSQSMVKAESTKNKLKKKGKISPMVHYKSKHLVKKQKPTKRTKAHKTKNNRNLKAKTEKVLSMEFIDTIDESDIDDVKMSMPVVCDFNLDENKPLDESTLFNGLLQSQSSTPRKLTCQSYKANSRKRKLSASFTDLVVDEEETSNSLKLISNMQLSVDSTDEEKVDLNDDLNISCSSSSLVDSPIRNDPKKQKSSCSPIQNVPNKLRLPPYNQIGNVLKKRKLLPHHNIKDSLDTSMDSLAGCFERNWSKSKVSKGVKQSELLNDKQNNIEELYRAHFPDNINKFIDDILNLSSPVRPLSPKSQDDDILIGILSNTNKHLPECHDYIPNLYCSSPIQENSFNISKINEQVLEELSGDENEGNASNMVSKIKNDHHIINEKYSNEDGRNSAINAKMFNIFGAEISGDEDEGDQIMVNIHKKDIIVEKHSNKDVTKASVKEKMINVFGEELSGDEENASSGDEENVSFMVNTPKRANIINEDHSNKEGFRKEELNEYRSLVGDLEFVDLLHEAIEDTIYTVFPSYQWKMGLEDIKRLGSQYKDTNSFYSILIKLIIKKAMRVKLHEHRGKTDNTKGIIPKLFRILSSLEDHRRQGGKFFLHYGLQKTCRLLLVNSNNKLNEEGLANMANLYFCSSHFIYKKSPLKKQKDISNEAILLLGKIASLYKGRCHAAFMAIINCSYFFFKSDFKRKPLGLLEETLLWIFVHGEWKGTQLTKKMLKGSLQQLKIVNENPLKPVDLLEKTLIKFMLNPMLEDIKLNCRLTLILLFEWNDRDWLLTHAIGAIQKFFKLYLKASLNFSDIVELFEDIMKSVTWDESLKKNFVKSLRGHNTQYFNKLDDMKVQS